MTYYGFENASLFLILCPLFATVWMWTLYLMHLNKIPITIELEIVLYGRCLGQEAFSHECINAIKEILAENVCSFLPLLSSIQGQSSPSLIDILKALFWKQREELTRHQLCWPDSGLGCFQLCERINFSPYFNKPHILYCFVIRGQNGTRYHCFIPISIELSLHNFTGLLSL